MTNIASPAPTYWAAVPDWAWHVIEDPKVYRFYAFLHQKIDSKTRQCWWRQSRLAEECKVSVSTISRWMRELKRVGAIKASYRWYGTKRIADMIELPMGDPRSPACTSTVDGHTRKSSTPTKRSTSSSKRGVLPGVQGTLFDLEPASQFDSRTTSQDTDNEKIVENDVTRGCGTPTSRVVGYWLSGRKERPKPGVIAGMGRAIKKCLDSGFGEDEVRRAIDALMMVGRDVSSVQLLVRFGLRTRPQRVKKRDYEKDPLWKHHPRSSTMTVERKIATTPPQYRRDSPTPASDETSAPSWRPSPMPCIPNTAGVSAERYCTTETVYDAGITRVVDSRGLRGVTPKEVLGRLFGPRP